MKPPLARPSGRPGGCALEGVLREAQAARLHQAGNVTALTSTSGSAGSSLCSSACFCMLYMFNMRILESK